MATLESSSSMATTSCLKDDVISSLDRFFFAKNITSTKEDAEVPTNTGSPNGDTQVPSSTFQGYDDG